MTDEIRRAVEQKIERLRAETVELSKKLWGSVASPGEAREDASRLVALFAELAELEETAARMGQIAGDLKIGPNGRQ